METIDSLAAGLARKEGYACLKRLLEISTACAEVYPYFDAFVPMLDDKSSFVRTRGLLLIAANARWDTQNKVDAVLDKCLAHILDAKPSVSRQSGHCVRNRGNVCVHSIPDSGTAGRAPRLWSGCR